MRVLGRGGGRCAGGEGEMEGAHIGKAEGARRRGVRGGMRMVVEGARYRGGGGEAEGAERGRMGTHSAITILLCAP